MANQEKDYGRLLNDYRSLWVNRSLQSENEQDDAKILLHESIKKDLLDEMTHPRVRKSPDVKLEWAKQRIQQSHLPADVKQALISLYEDTYEHLT